MNRFAGQTALVTGAGQGIGEAVARRMAAEGAAVLVADLNLEAAERVAADIVQAGGSAIGSLCDVQEEQSVERAVRTALEGLGRLDVLVSNAGITRDNLLHRMTLEEWDQVMAVHCRGGFLCARAASRPMVSQRSGKMVFLSSTSALGNRGQANYATAKAGIQGLVRTLALELGQFGIRVNSVAPGFVDTAMTRAVAERLRVPLEQFQTEAAARIPLGRLGTPEDIAGVVSFLCSEDAAYVSGQVLYVNGGRPQ